MAPYRYTTPEWEQSAIAIQESIRQVLGNRQWDVIPKGQRWTLLRKVGFWLFGEPKTLPTENNKFSGYEEKQLERIETLCDQMTRRINLDETDLNFAVTFIILGLDKSQMRKKQEKMLEEAEKEYERNKDNEDWAGKVEYDKIQQKKEKLKKDLEELNEDQVLPVFFCKASEADSYVVVDSWHGRVYNSWANFANEERLHGMCRYCSPKGGFYYSEMALEIDGSFYEFRYPNVDSFQTRALSALGALLAVAEIGAVVASFAVPVLPVVMIPLFVAHASLTASKSAMTLVDRNLHGQRTSFREAPREWLTLGLTVATAGMGVAAGLTGATAQVMGRAAIMGETAQRGTNAVPFMSLLFIPGARQGLDASSNMCLGMGIANLISNVFKIRRIRNLELLDFVGLMWSWVSFANNEVDFIDADIIARAQTDLVSMTRAALLIDMDIESVSAGNRAIYQEAGKTTVRSTVDLMRNMLQNVSLDGFEPQFTHDGRLILHRNQLVAPIKWLFVEEQTRLDIYHSVERYAKIVQQDGSRSQITAAKRDHRTNVAKLCETYRIDFNDMHRTAMATLCTSYSEISGRRVSSPDQILVGGRAIFANLSGHQKTRLAQVLQETLDNRTDLLRLALDFADMMNCGGLRKFLKYAEYIAGRFYEKRDEILNGIRQQLKNQTHAEVREHIGRLLGLENVTGPLIEYADALAIQHFSGSNRLGILIGSHVEGYKKYSRAIMSRDYPEELVRIGELSVDLVSHRYQKVKYFDLADDAKLQGLDEYVLLVEKVSGRAVNLENAVIVQEESCTIVVYQCPTEVVVVAVVNKLVEEGLKVSGIVTCMFYRSF